MIFKGSTPTLSFDTNAPLTNFEEMYLTLEQCGIFVLEKTKEQIQINGQSFEIELTQEETLLLSHKYDIEAQCRIKYTDGSVLTSEINTFNIGRVLKQEVI
jgi:hypothetical protein